MIAGVGSWVLRLAATGSLEALLVRRALPPYRGAWFTVDGLLGPGELPRDAALRELREETALEATLLLRDVDTPTRVVTCRGAVWLHGFVAFVPAGAPVTLNMDHSGHRWLGVQQALAAVPLESQRSALERALRSIASPSPEHLVEALDAARIAHPGGNLRDHLRRTAALVRQFGARPALQAAGWLHASYGTDGFEERLVDPDDRGPLRVLAGEEVERLVYLYAACDRAIFYASLARGRQDYRDRFDGTRTTLSPGDARDLVELTFANELDLCRHDASLRRALEGELVPLFERCHGLASEAAYHCFLDTFPAARSGA
jgi:8-oxo-dGTP pyrophosphatase MutT (NUDIX family)